MAVDLSPDYIAYHLKVILSNCPGIHECYAIAIWVLTAVYFVLMICLSRASARFLPMIVLCGHVPMAIFLFPMALCTPIGIDPFRGLGLFMFYGQSAWLAALLTIIGIRSGRNWVWLVGLSVSLSWPLFVMYVITMWGGFT